MAADLIDKLISDIVAITERLMSSEPVDLAALQTGPTNLERRRSGRKPRPHRKRVAKSTKKGAAHAVDHPMAKGVHRTVC